MTYGPTLETKIYPWNGPTSATAAYPALVTMGLFCLVLEIYPWNGQRANVGNRHISGFSNYGSILLSFRDISMERTTGQRRQPLHTWL